MDTQAEEQLKQLQKEKLKINIFEAPGTIMVGFGLYGKYAAEGDAFHPFLNDPQNVNILLFVGIIIMVWGGYSLFRKTQQINQFKQQHGL